MTEEIDSSPESMALPRDWSMYSGEGTGTAYSPSAGASSEERSVPQMAPVSPYQVRMQERFADPEGNADSGSQLVENTHRDRIYSAGSTIVNNLGYAFQDHLKEERVRRQYRRNPDAIVRDLRSVVSPPGEKEHLNSLRHHHLLVLTSRPGTGHNTATIHRAWKWKSLLDRERRVQTEISQLFPSEAQDLITEIDKIGPYSVAYLDVVNDMGMSRELTTVLSEARMALEERKSYLVVTLHESAESSSIKAEPKLTFRLKSPAPRRVLQTLLQASIGSGRLKKLLDSPQIISYIEDKFPPQLKKMAEWMVTKPDAHPKEIVENLDDFLNDWSRSINNLFDENLDAMGRALLLSMATARGQDNETIVTMAEDFLNVAEYDFTPPPLLEEVSLTTKLATLDSHPAGVQNLKEQRGLSDALLPHLWREYPRFRNPLRKWIVQLLKRNRRNHINDTALAMIVIRLVELAESASAPYLISDSVEKIFKEKDTKGQYSYGAFYDAKQARIKIASEILIEGAINPVTGSFVRRRMYDWSRYNRDVHDDLLLAICEVCKSEDYLEMFFSTAMYRCKYLTRSRSVRVQAAAAWATIEIFKRDPLQALVYFHDWFESKESKESSNEVVQLFPRLISDDSVCESLAKVNLNRVRAMRNRLLDLWKDLLDKSTPDQATECIHTWISLISNIPSNIGNELEEVVVGAGRSSYRRVGRLGYAVSRPVTGYAEDEIRVSLQQRIHDFKGPELCQITCLLVKTGL